VTLPTEDRARDMPELAGCKLLNSPEKTLQVESVEVEEVEKVEAVETMGPVISRLAAD
jgi:hypothetical protein